MGKKNYDWWSHAACEGMWSLFDDEPMYFEHPAEETPEGRARIAAMTSGVRIAYQNKAANAAIAICNECPVKAQCLEDALINGDVTGIRGGLTARKRIPLMVERGIAFSYQNRLSEALDAAILEARAKRAQEEIEANVFD